MSISSSTMAMCGAEFTHEGISSTGDAGRRRAGTLNAKYTTMYIMLTNKQRTQPVHALSSLAVPSDLRDCRARTTSLVQRPPQSCTSTLDSLVLLRQTARLVLYRPADGDDASIFVRRYGHKGTVNAIQVSLGAVPRGTAVCRTKHCRSSSAHQKSLTE